MKVKASIRERSHLMHIKSTGLDRVILFINYILLFLAVVVVVVPLIYVVVASFMEPTALLNKGLSFNLADYSVEGYKMILSNDAMLRGFVNALFKCSRIVE